MGPGRRTTMQRQINQTPVGSARQAPVYPGCTCGLMTSRSITLRSIQTDRLLVQFTIEARRRIAWPTPTGFVLIVEIRCDAQSLPRLCLALNAAMAAETWGTKISIHQKLTTGHGRGYAKAFVRQRAPGKYCALNERGFAIGIGWNGKSPN